MRRVNDLTAREIEISRLVCKGYSNLEIAYSLHISDGTVEQHLKSITSKLGFGSRNQLATNWKSDET
jgi:DNA-binding NarL/FixJ family response regulator